MKFSDITTRNELADFLKIPRKKLTEVLYVRRVENYYETFEIAKKSGGVRVINAPYGSLKSIQVKLASALAEYLNEIRISNNIKASVSHAFEKGKSIITNAAVHRNKRYILNVDLENFFDSFHFGRVCGYFEKNKYFLLPHEVAVVISTILCCNGVLPQGAPTSPVVTNMMCHVLDYKILMLSKKYKVNYTRYADDMTFSTNDKQFLDKKDDFYKSLLLIIEKSGFKVNSNKTRLHYNDSRQVVTGLTVNRTVNVDRTYYKQTRAMADCLYRTGEFRIDNIDASISRLEGRFSFINQLNRYNNSINCENKHTFRNLSGRELEYRKFLFYKYFFANKKPLIVTEGKTDILYIKAALKKMYKDYPELITKRDDGTFYFKISFLKRTKRLRYFFNFSLDGADTMKQLYCFFTGTGGNGYVNYFNFFANHYGRKPKNPVVFIFDNELANKDKPIKKFLSSISGSSMEAVIKDKLYVNLIDGSNLYLITNQLMDGKSECEIEDLFDEKTRGHKHNGKSLCLKDKFDTDKYYGKDIFSKYVLNNYMSIDFSNFKVILDNIKDIANAYKTN